MISLPFNLTINAIIAIKGVFRRAKFCITARENKMKAHYGSPIQALLQKPYWSSGKLLPGNAFPMIEGDNFSFIFHENWQIYP